MNPEETRRLLAIWLVTVLLLVAGLFSPIITIKKFLVVQNTFSIFSGVMELVMDGKILLFLIVCSFSIVLPTLKLWVLFRLISGTADRRFDIYLELMHRYGRWSMLDVFVVAVLVVTVKLGAIANVDTRLGLYAFAAAVVLTMYLTGRVAKAYENRVPA